MSQMSWKEIGAVFLVSWLIVAVFITVITLLGAEWKWSSG